METTICTMLFLICPADYQFIAAEGRCGLQYGCLAGYGGKWDPTKGDTTIASSGIRELGEEAHLTITEDNLEKVGVIFFARSEAAAGLGRPDSRLVEMHVYQVHDWIGEPQSTEAFGPPQRFRRSQPPTERMFPGSGLWVPSALIGHKFIARLNYGPENAVENFEIRDVTTSLCPIRGRLLPNEELFLKP